MSKSNKRGPAAQMDAPPFLHSWLHAGLFSTQDGTVVNAYFTYGIVRDKATDKYKWDRIYFASDKEGHGFGRWNLGELKINMITWDSHISDQWSHYLDDSGTWLPGKKTAGRTYRVEILKDICMDVQYVDPYPNGLETGTLAPPINVMFPGKRSVSVYLTNPEGSQLRLNEGTSDMFFPGTEIVFTSGHIIREAYREICKQPEKVIARFLKGQLRTTDPIQARKSKPIEQIESAFLKLGLRINTKAAVNASKQSQEEGICVLETKAWKAALPYALSSCDHEKFHSLMQLIQNQFDTKRRQSKKNTPFDKLVEEIAGGIKVEQSPAPSSIAEVRGNSPANQNTKDVTYLANTYFPGTRIFCDPKGIIVSAYKQVSNSASDVVSRFLTGRLRANLVRNGYDHSSMAQIESAFFKKGFRIHTGAALEASLAFEKDPTASIIDSEIWQRNRPVKLRPTEHNDVDNMLQGLESLFVHQSDDEGSEDDTPPLRNQRGAVKRKRGVRDVSTRSPSIKRLRACAFNCEENAYTDGVCRCNE